MAEQRRRTGSTTLLLGVAAILAAVGYVVVAAFVAPAIVDRAAGPQAAAGASGWATDVNWADVRPGACIDQSFDWSTNEVDVASFDANNTGFRIVDCSSDHVARVLLAVDKPLSTSWQRFGSSDGVTLEEVNAWVVGVCAATQELVDYSRGDGDDPSTVGVAKSGYGLRILGQCMLVSRAGERHSPGDETIEDLRRRAAEIRSFTLPD